MHYTPFSSFSHSIPQKIFEKIHIRFALKRDLVAIDWSNLFRKPGYCKTFLCKKLLTFFTLHENSNITTSHVKYLLITVSWYQSYPFCKFSLPKLKFCIYGGRCLCWQPFSLGIFFKKMLITWIWTLLFLYSL